MSAYAATMGATTSVAVHPAATPVLFAIIYTPGMESIRRIIVPDDPNHNFEAELKPGETFITVDTRNGFEVLLAHIKAIAMAFDDHHAATEKLARDISRVEKTQHDLNDKMAAVKISSENLAEQQRIFDAEAAAMHAKLSAREARVK